MIILNSSSISAWNDNGKDGQIENDPHLFYRTDFFGGLGWMLSKEVCYGKFMTQIIF